MAKKKRVWTPEDQARYDETTRMLEERIAYHRAMAEQERLRRERRENSRLRRLFPWRIRIERVA